MKDMKTDEQLKEEEDANKEYDAAIARMTEDSHILTSLLGSEALAKACSDNPFDYALKLRTGEVIRFHGAKIINREWIHVELKPIREQPRPTLPYPAERGMDIRISEIVWVMDAPEGS